VGLLLLIGWLKEMKTPATARMSRLGKGDLLYIGWMSPLLLKERKRSGGLAGKCRIGFPFPGRAPLGIAINGFV
jgi:hypothetical protein